MPNASTKKGMNVPRRPALGSARGNHSESSPPAAFWKSWDSRVFASWMFTVSIVVARRRRAAIDQVRSGNPAPSPGSIGTFIAARRTLCHACRTTGGRTTCSPSGRAPWSPVTLRFETTNKAPQDPELQTNPGADRLGIGFDCRPPGRPWVSGKHTIRTPDAGASVPQQKPACEHPRGRPRQRHARRRFRIHPHSRQAPRGTRSGAAGTTHAIPGKATPYWISTRSGKAQVLLK